MTTQSQEVVAILLDIIRVFHVELCQCVQLVLNFRNIFMPPLGLFFLKKMIVCFSKIAIELLK